MRSKEQKYVDDYNRRNNCWVWKAIMPPSKRELAEMIMLGKVLGVTKVDGKDNMVKLPKKVGDIVYFEEHWYESNSEAN